jgi:hypothetical protein
MVVAAFIFGLTLLSISVFFLIFYVQNQKSMRGNHRALERQRERQLKFQADLQARIDMEARQFEEARQSLLKQAGGDDDRDSGQRNIEHAA